MTDATTRSSRAARATAWMLAITACAGIAVVLVLAVSIETRIENLQSTTFRLLRAAAAERTALDSRLDLYTGLTTENSAAADRSPAEFLQSSSAEASTWAELTSALESAGIAEMADPLAQARIDFETLESERGPPGAPGAGSGTADDEVTTAGERVRLESELLSQRLDERAENDLADLASRSDQLRATLLVLLVGSALMGIVGGVLARRRAVAQRVVTERDNDSARRSAFGSRLQRGLEMTRDEDEVFALMAEAIDQAVPTVGVEVLLADSSRAHFRRLHFDGDPAPNCGAASPADCPAATSGRTEVFRDGSALDVCPRLRGRAESSVCVPLSVAGRTTGVIHVCSSPATAPNPSAIDDLELIARRGSERVAMVRAFETTSIEANTDALTGLANRRAMQRRLREMERQGQRYSLAFGDLDNFKMLNDRHGHDIGDRALRAFAMMLGEMVRPGDLAVRYGGEEFVVVFPDCDLEQSAAILDRIRARLAELLRDGSIPAFTVSFGLAASIPDQTFDQTIAAADFALLAAKASGRDRVVRADGSDIAAHASAPPEADPDLVFGPR